MAKHMRSLCAPALARRAHSLQALTAPPSSSSAWSPPGGAPLSQLLSQLPPGPLRQAAEQAGAGVGWLAGLAGQGLARAAAVVASAPLQAAGQQPAEAAYHAPPLVTAWVGSAPRSFPLQLKQSGR